ncbi:hypothetical protein N7467_000449 [Penicillium canescens]|nr:hypothetical protein N7467_000449 [Penicillium canescens]
MASSDVYYLQPTAHSPNSTLPVIHYRAVLPSPRTEECVTEFLTAGKWEKRGTWGPINIRHFHPNSHECYGIFQGSSTLLLGAATGDDVSVGMKLVVNVGDVIVLPAGTAHSSLESTADYRYVGLYPENCPRWRNEIGRSRIDLRVLRKEIAAVKLPEEDPVYGKDGPLCQLWSKDIMAKL